jgi:hypothetical protein
MSAIASTKSARSDAEIREGRENGMAVFRTSLMLSMPLVGFITAPMMYAGMIVGAMWGFARFGGFGPGNILSATAAGFIVAAAFIAFVHPKLGWLKR